MEIKIKPQFTLFLIVVATLLFCGDVYSQNIQSKGSRQSAFDAFSKENYEQAYMDFSELLLTYSKDPLYKYYSGVCLVKLNREPDKAIILLQEAVHGSTVIKSAPSDAWFYLGRAQQMSGLFTEAVKSYNLFIDQAGKKVARDLNVSEYIQGCNEKKGALKEAVNLPAEIINKATPDIIPEENKTLTEKVTKPPVKKTDNPRENLPADYDKALAEAMNYQVKADSLNTLAAEYKSELEKLPSAQKASAKAKISELESLAATYQKLADQKFSNTETKPVITKDSVVLPKDNAPPKEAVQKADNQIKKTINANKDAVPVPLPVTKKTGEVYSLFEVITNPVFTQDQKIPIDHELPAGLIYRIQLAVFSNPVAPSFFKGITPVFGFKVSGTDITKYYAGMFRRMADASRALLGVKQLGFRDAFLNAVSDGKPVSIERASILEKEWGEKPFSVVVKPVSGTTGNTNPPELSFRVEVTRSAKPLKDEMVETFKKMAGGRGFEIITTEGGNIVYLIGKFLTFESASEYADLLVRNGYSEAKVVAWLGNKEIPVDNAKQLFEKLE